MAAFSRPMIGHRGEAFKNLYRDIHPRLQNTLRNETAGLSFHLVGLGRDGGLDPQSRRSRRALLHVRRVLRQMARRRQTLRQKRRAACRSSGENISIPARSTKNSRPESSTRSTLIHNETSTGVMNPLPEDLRCRQALSRCRADRRYRLLFLGRRDRDGRTRHRRHAYRLAKGARPASRLFALLGFGKRLRSRSRTDTDRGYYFDFLEFKKQQDADMTPSTPSIGHIHALQSKLDEIFAEGLADRHARHARTNRLVHEWVRRERFRLLRRGRLPLRHTHLRAERSRDRRRQTRARSTRKTPPRDRRRLRQDQRHKPSDSRTWATKRRKRRRTCSNVWMIVSAHEARKQSTSMVANRGLPGLLTARSSAGHGVCS